MENEKTLTTIVDLEFAKRLENTEAVANARFVEGRRRLNPDGDAEWIEVAGTRAMYDGADSPCTQTFGLGVCGQPSEDDLGTLENFFQSRGAAVHHEVSPLAPLSLVEQLNARGYHPIEFTNVLFRAIGRELVQASNPRDVRIHVRAARADEFEQWARTSAEGWSEDASVAELIFDLARCYSATEGATSLFALIDNQPIATGVVAIADRVVLLAGASTIPRARNQGAQSALIAHRLQFAIEQNCDIAMMCAVPGSRSQRNAQRNGFQIAYTRIKWRLGKTIG